jgi:hypothetical protein
VHTYLVIFLLEVVGPGDEALSHQLVVSFV